MDPANKFQVNTLKSSKMVVLSLKINFSRHLHETDKTQNRARLYIFADRVFVFYFYVVQHIHLWSFAVNTDMFQPQTPKCSPFNVYGKIRYILFFMTKQTLLSFNLAETFNDCFLWKICSEKQILPRIFYYSKNF